MTASTKSSEARGPLTEEYIKSLGATDRVAYHADARSGLRLRCYPTGTKKWVIRTEVAGKTREKVIGQWPAMPVKEARRRAGVQPKPAKAGPMTFEAAARQWHTAKIAPKYRASAAIVWRYLERDCTRLMAKRMDTITQAQLAAVIEQKIKDGHNAADKLTRLLRKFFRWAASHELVQSNPMEALTAKELDIDKPEPRDRVATNDELRAVWNAPAPHGPMLRFALLTACRIGEARGAEMSQVKDGVWTFGPTKNGKFHSLPLTKTAAKLLAAGWELRSPEALYQVLHLRVPGLNPHDLRRTAATRMRKPLGVSSDVIAAILNHTPPRLQRTYEQPDLTDEMRAALELWERELLKIVRRRK